MTTLVEAAQRLDRLGFMPSKAGNLSVRTARGFTITPSGLAYDALTEGDLVKLDMSGERIGGHRNPSSEWRLHRAIYAARPEAMAIVHTHSPRATALACARRDIPPFHYMIALAGGSDIRCAPYALFGTEALAEAAVRALEGRRACLLANHGVVAIGQTLREAETLAREVENLAGMYLDMLAARVEPVPLSEAELAEVRAQFEGYGRRLGIGLAPRLLALR
ncbi:MAG: class II aldolase/adducin family protein [Roseococcus sp.]|nr:class II aldolase/adducin family protein [Roseococcus sp.]